MKNMKKIAALGMSAVMVAGMMAGCGSSSDFLPAATAREVPNPVTK